MFRRFILAITFPMVMMFTSLASAQDNTFVITIKDHKFHPAEVLVPAGKKVKLLVKNEDRTPEEFESYSLNREKIIGGGKQAIIYVGPLKPGKYKFFGEFHEKTAQGVLIAK